MSRMRRMIFALALGAAVGSLSAPAAAGFSDGYLFLKAVREANVLDAKKYADEPGSTIINTRSADTGEMAMHIVVRRRDAPWIGFLHGLGANVDARDKSGATPLIIAAELAYLEGVRVLTVLKANVNIANNAGETPLIKAVHNRDAASARILLDSGANPDLSDNIAGMSARDYAKNDRRAAAILKLIEDSDKNRTAKKATVAGPGL